MDFPELKAFPAVKDLRPTLIVDSREQTPLVFTRLPSVRAGLQSGDYSFLGGEEGLFAVERKSIQDLVSCCSGERERFERELHRLRGFRFARLLIVGRETDIAQCRFRGGMNPKSVMHTLCAWEARFIPVVFKADPETAAQAVESWAFWAAREILKTASLFTRANTAEPAPEIEPTPQAEGTTP